MKILRRISGISRNKNISVSAFAIQCRNGTSCNLFVCAGYCLFKLNRYIIRTGYRRRRGAEANVTMPFVRSTEKPFPSVIAVPFTTAVTAARQAALYQADISPLSRRRETDSPFWASAGLHRHTTFRLQVDFCQCSSQAVQRSPKRLVPLTRHMSDILFLSEAKTSV